jgi:hypothetical protein
MRSHLVAALLLAGAALAATAQRGAAHAASSGRSSFSAHSSATVPGHSPTGFSRSSTAGFSRSGLAGFRSFAPASRYSYANSHPSAVRTQRVPSTLRLARPSFYTRRPVAPWRPVRPMRPMRPMRPVAGRGPWLLRQHPGFGLGYVYDSPGWVAPDYLSYCHPDFDDCYGGLGYHGQEGYYGQEGYEDGSQSNLQTPTQQPGYGSPSDTAQPQPYPYAPQYSEPYASPGQPEAPPYPQASAPAESEDAVTLIFKDGRPPEQIHNYALTRTTVYVIRDGRRHDIPVSDLDLAATERANHDAGISFQLPHTAAKSAP